MTYKTIFTVLQSEAEAGHLLDGAVSLARRFDAHLIGFHSEPMQLAYASAVGFPDAEYIRETTEMGIARTKKIAGLFGERMRRENISSAWGALDMVGSEHAVGDLSLAHSVDLIVTSQPDPAASSSDSSEIDSLLYDAGRPVLVLPRNKPCPANFKRILVGWNGSKQAARAVFDALPLLKEAEQVELLVVDRSEGEEEIGKTIAATLQRHGVPILLSRETNEGLSVEEALANRVAATNADLLVLGAYGHSWLREFLFGGVTQQILKSCPVATLLSH